MNGWFTREPLTAFYGKNELDIHVFVSLNCLFSFSVSLRKWRAQLLKRSNISIKCFWSQNKDGIANVCHQFSNFLWAIIIYKIIEYFLQKFYLCEHKGWIMNMMMIQYLNLILEQTIIMDLIISTSIKYLICDIISIFLGNPLKPKLIWNKPATKKWFHTFSFNVLLFNFIISNGAIQFTKILMVENYIFVFLVFNLNIYLSINLQAMQFTPI